MEIKTKFDVGDKVWFMLNSKPIEAKIYKINIYGTKDEKQTSITYSVESSLYFGVFNEKKLYASKEELINSLWYGYKKNKYEWKR